MKNTKIIPHIYGYAVCLTAIIVFLISISQIIFAVINLSDPLHSGWQSNDSPSLASFENYKTDILNSCKNKSDLSDKYIPDDATLRKMYTAAVNNKISYENHRNTSDLLVGIILIIISIFLFIYHWKWMKKISKK
ncbi:hypothetical protein D9V86_09455 [Bacteroidetes/Chlorobi group bacterium ChocPot_Mid]|jgi:hypothetical protein|nr:MAG: hypothetical protein D9V86_09455 [Bacteroidetes/Chlorobi group bacterium ChocPot_Mid]